MDAANKVSIVQNVQQIGNSATSAPHANGQSQARLARLETERFAHHINQMHRAFC